ncbi:MAG: NUDIX domain-containing protein [Bacteroidetes bacterium]|nr:NUDIX domain-containing protein [Bacteroidota bacterium]
MKIFLNNKCIELTDSRPARVHPGNVAVEYKSARQLKKAFRAFEADDLQMKLILWSERGDSRWREDFFSLFKRIEAAGGWVKNERGERLFIFRLGKWDLPKGKLSGKEKVEEAALREVMEETGLKKVLITGPLPSTYHIYTRKGKQILKQTRWFEMEADSKQSLVPQTEEDISEVKWVKKKDVEKVLLNSYGSIIELVRSEK